MYDSDILSQLIGKRALKGILLRTVGSRRRRSFLAFHLATNCGETDGRLLGLRASRGIRRKVKEQHFTRRGFFRLFPPGQCLLARAIRIVRVGLRERVCDVVLESFTLPGWSEVLGKRVRACLCVCEGEGGELVGALSPVTERERMLNNDDEGRSRVKAACMR